MFCKNCGEEFSSGKFCPKCGTPVANAPSATNAQTPNPNAGQTPVSGPSFQAGDAFASAAGTAMNAAKSASAAIGNVRSSINSAATNYANSKTNITGGFFPYDIDRNRKYFDPKGIKNYVIMIAIGVLLLFIWVGMSSGYSDRSNNDMSILVLLGGLALVFIGAIVIYVRRFMRATDQEIDAIYNQIYQMGTKEAEEKCALMAKPLIDPMRFGGPTPLNEPARCWAKVGKDLKIRYSNYQMSTVFCMPNLLHYYSVSQSLTIRKRETSTIDLYYTDISMMEIDESYSGDSRTGLDSQSSGGGNIVIHMTSGEKFSLAFSKEQVSQVYGLRTLLRENKIETRG